ncbi:MAG TPA: serine hydrolase domain-containing protein, partial [Kofleriaceae bacterium]|nr:serine hydrolase domain-containing protein [Kofleriaceae bacterium]
MDNLPNLAPEPCRGSYADGFAPVAERFAAQIRDGSEVGAGLAVYQRGRCVVDLWGGSADVANRIPWARDSRIVVFSVTKGLSAMALALLADRGKLDWDVPVATYWPGFAASGKQAITVRTLVNHRGGLVAIDEPLSLNDCILPARRERLVSALERQRPAWDPGTAQGYHAITFGLYVRELFERIAGEDLGAFLQRELFEPLAADVALGTPAELDPRVATLYSPSTPKRLLHALAAAIRPDTAEGRIARALIGRHSLPRAAFGNPRAGREGILVYNSTRVRRAVL